MHMAASDEQWLITAVERRMWYFTSDMCNNDWWCKWKYYTFDYWTKKNKVELLYKSEKGVKYLGVTIPYHQFLQS